MHLKGLFVFILNEACSPYSLYPKWPWWKMQYSDTSFLFNSQLTSLQVMPSSDHSLGAGAPTISSELLLLLLPGPSLQWADHPIMLIKWEKQLFRKCVLIPVTSLNSLSVC